MSEDSTIVITDIHEALAESDKEAGKKSACLLVVGGELNGEIFDLKDGETSFGRGNDNTYPMDFRGISRKHFAVHMAENQAIIEDLGFDNLDEASRNWSYMESNPELLKSNIEYLPSLFKTYPPIKVRAINLYYSMDPQSRPAQELSRALSKSGVAL